MTKGHKEVLCTVQSMKQATRIITEIVSQTEGWVSVTGMPDILYRKVTKGITIRYGVTKKGIRTYNVLKYTYLGGGAEIY